MDVIVVGAGVVGLAATHELSQAGHRVTVVSADVPGARQSAGRSRIFRLAHADGPLTQAAAESLARWQAWERQSQAPLLDRVGLLLTGDMSARAIHLDRWGGLEHLSGRAHPLGVSRDDWWLERTGAAIAVEQTLRFLQRSGTLVLAEVTRVQRTAVTLAGGERLEADRVVVCAGPDTYRLLGVGEPPRMRSVRFSFALREPPAAPAPCWIQRDDRLCEPFYAVVDGPDHYSVGLSAAGSAEIPEGRHVRDAHRRVLDIVARALPGLHPVAERVIACEYSVNPGPAGTEVGHDGWDLREVDGVIGLTGPALFKFAPLLGRLVLQQLQAPPAGAR